MSQSAYSATAQSQLRRLGTLTDVVYAVALVMIIRWLPLPEESSAEGAVWLLDLFAEHSTNLVAVLIEETVAVQIEAFAEPLTALVTLPFAYVGELTWNLAWLAYLPIAALLRRRGSRAES